MIRSVICKMPEVRIPGSRKIGQSALPAVWIDRPPPVPPPFQSYHAGQMATITRIAPFIPPPAALQWIPGWAVRPGPHSGKGL